MKRGELGVSGKGIVIVILFAVFMVTGCAAPSSLMMKVPEVEPIGPPNADKTKVVFMRPSGVGFGIMAKVIDVTSEESPVLVGFVGAKTKVAYETDPGESIFMVMGGENTPFLKVDLSPGKIYYAKVNPKMGFLYARFSMTPIPEADLDGEEFNQWYTACTLYRNSDESLNWFNENLEGIKKKRMEKLPQSMR